MFEKFARRCSRQDKQTILSDADFLGALRVKFVFIAQNYNRQEIHVHYCTKQNVTNYFYLHVYMLNIRPLTFMSFQAFAHIMVPLVSHFLMLQYSFCSGSKEPIYANFH